MRKSLAFVLFLLGPLSGVMHAQTSTATMAIAATVIKGCLTLATPMVFGNYTAASSSASTINGTITVTCTVGTTYTVGMDAGTAVGATTSTRAMLFTTNKLNYGLYRDTSYSQNWGNNPGVDTLPGTGTGLPQALVVYGQIPSGQSVPTGAYADLVNISVIY